MKSNVLVPMSVTQYLEGKAGNLKRKVKVHCANLPEREETLTQSQVRFKSRYSLYCHICFFNFCFPMERILQSKRTNWEQRDIVLALFSIYFNKYSPEGVHKKCNLGKSFNAIFIKIEISCCT